MSETSIHTQDCHVRLSTRFCLREKMVEWLFSRLESGSLTVVLPNGIHLFFHGPAPGPQAKLQILRWRMLMKTAMGGDLGFAESYIAGDWEAPDLKKLIQLFARNSAALSKRIHGIDIFRKIPNLKHFLRRNSKRRSRKNIEDHYDLGNEFYAAWLDREMIYSSGLYASGPDQLEQAQARKVARIVNLAQVTQGNHILEIGAGWGSLACALGRAGAHVEGITLSPSQLALADNRSRAAGLAGQVSFALRDYRDVTGHYDRIVSVEMIEAVGEEYLETYFRTIARTLKPGGRAVIQAITIADDRFETYRADADFIQTYIFPGGFLPAPSLMLANAERAGLTLVHDETFGESYARTLMEWHGRFNSAWERIATLGFDARFRRIWNYYLCYCAAGFSEGLINVGLYVFQHKQHETET